MGEPAPKSQRHGRGSGTFLKALFRPFARVPATLAPNNRLAYSFEPGANETVSRRSPIQACDLRSIATDPVDK